MHKFKIIARLMLLFLLLASKLSVAQATEQLGLLDAASTSPIHNFAPNNPAAIPFLPLSKYSEVAAGYLMRSSSQLHLRSQGNETTQTNLSAFGYTKETAAMAWGSASYAKGTDLNVRWTNTTDVHKTGPYVMADSTGGNRNFERFEIEGALAQSFSFGTVGFAAQYRAEGTYRLRDPRAATTVSDLHLKLGWTRQTTNYEMGLAAWGESYFQRASSYNFTPDRKDKFYLMYGFGLFNSKYSTTESSYTFYYNGYYAGTHAFIRPRTQNNGWIASLHAQNGQTTPKLNNIAPAIFHALTLQAEAGYQWVQNKNIHQATVNIQHHEDKGTEQHYETIVTNEETQSTDQRLISKSNKYQNTLSQVGILLKSELNRNNKQFIAMLKPEFTLAHSLYRTTNYQQTIDKGILNAGLAYSHRTDKAVKAIELDAVYAHTFSSQLVTPESNAIVRGQLLPDFAVLSASTLKLGGTLRYTHKLRQNHALKVQLEAFRISASEGRHIQQYQFSIAYLF
jgi:hypothetical protein